MQAGHNATSQQADLVEVTARLRALSRAAGEGAVILDPETNAPDIDAKKLSAAVKNWNQIQSSSEYWLDALFEESWAYFMAGQYPKALGNIHTIESPYFPGGFYPEAEILKAVIYFSNCNYDAAVTVSATGASPVGLVGTVLGPEVLEALTLAHIGHAVHDAAEPHDHVLGGGHALLEHADGLEPEGHTEAAGGDAGRIAHDDRALAAPQRFHPTDDLE